MELGGRLAKVLDVELPETTAASLELLDELLTRWGRAVDVSGFKSTDERDRRYFGEALAALPWVPSRGRALDIGSGGGSPALPLAVARRTVVWTLVEANAKKALFLDEAVRALGLQGAEVVRARYERFAPGALFDVATVRGIAVTAPLLDKASSEVRPGGRLLWFTSKARLAEAGERPAPRWTRVSAPHELVSGGGFLGVFERDP